MIAEELRLQVAHPRSPILSEALICRCYPPPPNFSRTPRTRLRPALCARMEEVRATLASWNLGQYAEAFFEEGYDDLAYLKTLGEDALQRVADSVGMKPGESHVARSPCEGEG